MALMDISNVDTAALLPSVVGSDPQVRAILEATDSFWQAIAAAIPTLGVLATIDRQPDAVVDRLAYQFHCDFYDATWPLEQKRQVVIDSIRLHRLAGTRGAVEDTIANIWGNTASVMEWWEYGGTPGTFQVFLTGSMGEADVNLFVQSIRHVKRATDQLTVSIVNDEGAQTEYAAIGVHVVKYYAL